VYSDFFDKKSGVWTNHVELGLWADLFIVAPLSANTLAKFANGLCDNLLSATYLSARCPVMLAPAMDLDMYQHPSVLENLRKVQSFGNILLDAESGELASGLSGQGRMMEPEHILIHVDRFFSQKGDFKNKKILITLGPTQESIDPVRYISNHSSGKMGMAIANEFKSRGAEVYLISGPIYIPVDTSRFHVTKVKSAAEMYEASEKLHSVMDICVFAAAVADYSPAEVANDKIKKEDSEMSILLKKNVDIAFQLGELKKTGQIHVGFALETTNEEAFAKAKLDKKNFDLIVLNSANEKGAGFQHDTNSVKIFWPDGSFVDSGLVSKVQVAKLILDEIKKIPVWI
jgi:phosphopantothenoylcysteine decarboxylase/phosphopantothenate--cysteine ligase